MDSETRRPLSHVRSTLVFPIFRYAILMVILSLALGLITRQLNRTHLGGLPLSTQWFVGHYLGQLHGDVILLGFALPVGLGLITYTLRGEIAPLDLGLLHTLFRVIVIGSLATLALAVYQGVAIVTAIGANPALSLDQVDQQLFSGSSALRAAVYAVSHATLGISTSWYVLKLYAILGSVGAYRRNQAK